MKEKGSRKRALIPMGELELECIGSQMGEEEDIRRIAREALEPYLPSWRSQPFTRCVPDYKIRNALPTIFNEDTRSFDPNKQALYDAACRILQEEGFVAVGGRWYVPEQKLK